MTLKPESSPVKPEERSFGVHKDMPIGSSCASADRRIVDGEDFTDGIGPPAGNLGQPDRPFRLLVSRVPERVHAEMKVRRIAAAGFLYGWILCHAEKEGDYIVSRIPFFVMSRETGLGKERTKKLLKALEEAGFILRGDQHHPHYLRVDVFGNDVPVPEEWKAVEA